VPKWSGDPGQLVHLPPGQRSGLLTRAAFLVSGSTQTNPVVRGVKIRRSFLCDNLPPPPASIANMLRLPAADPNLTTRQRFEQKTADPFCMACHSQINPLGFALENFDGLGRFRTAEKIYDDNGQFLSEKSIDPVVAPYILSGDARTSTSPVEFDQILASSGKAQKCFVRKYFEFTYRQAPDLERDGCALESLRQNLTGPEGSLKKMFLSVARSPAFKLRNISDAP
jgi:hypothetical protein